MSHKNRSKKSSVCEICSKIFFVMFGATGKYCSRKCGSIGTQKKETRNCVECGNIFEVHISSKKQYCNSKCVGKNLQKRPKKDYGKCICLKCGISFTKKRKESKGLYCSAKCSNSKPSKNRLSENKCNECGKMFRPLNRQQKTCSLECANKTKMCVVGENHPLWKPKKIMNCEICGKEK
nr:hypothetical protein [Pyrinomonadaceae bacterium]